VLADGGGNALAELHRGGADLLLAELSMTPMSGIELTRSVRSLTQWRDVPVILISSRAEPNGVVRALDAGADDVVVKPFHFEVLAARIARQLARARSVAQLRADNQTLDARVVERAIALGEMRDRYMVSEAERRRLSGMVTI
jgi:DNA-binding response OmpR family regulator